MIRKAYGIKNALGKWFHGKSVWQSGWTTDFSRARIFGRKQDASNCANESGLAGRGFWRGQKAGQYAPVKLPTPNTPPVVVELAVTEKQHDDATRRLGDGQSSPKDDSHLVLSDC